MATLVDLDEICAYLIGIADNHKTKHTRTHSKAHGKSEEMVTFVIRRCVNELMEDYGPIGRTRLPQPSLQSASNTDTRPDSTYRNRATT